MSDASGSKMMHGNRASRGQRSTTIDEPLKQNDSEDDTSVHAVENDSYVKRGSTPSQKRWTSSEESGRSYNRNIKTVCIIYEAKILRSYNAFIVNFNFRHNIIINYIHYNNFIKN